MTARDIPGWNHDIDPWAEWIAPRIPHGGTYLEVGVFLGASLAKMGELRPDIHLIAVDPWIEEPSPGWAGVGIFADVVARHGSLFLAFLGEMMAHAPDVLRRTWVVRGTARMVTLHHRHVDFLFIDGAHDVHHVADDLAAFAPCVRRGGIIAGHDYTPDFPGVVEAVDAYFGEKPCLGTAKNEGPTCWWMKA